MRDINERDEVPERRVKRDYVSLGVRSEQQDLKLASDAGAVRVYFDAMRLLHSGTQWDASAATLFAPASDAPLNFAAGAPRPRVLMLVVENDRFVADEVPAKVRVVPLAE